MEIIDLIEKDIDVEGIFRRSGSVAKLKELRVSKYSHNSVDLLSAVAVKIIQYSYELSG